METYADYKLNVEIVGDVENLARRDLELFIEKAEEAIKSKDVFYVAISGGNTPRRFYELIGEDQRSLSLAWDKIELFWVDERYVAPDCEASNYKLAADTFLNKVAIPKENIHRIPTEDSDVGVSVHLYEETIREVFRLGENERPVFDLIMLGMGKDGHTGSLFANCYASFDNADLACVVYELDDTLNRITLTHPVLCAARHVTVLVSGPEKARILKEVLNSEPDEVRYPIHSLWPILDRVTWLVDSEAARLL